jgi:hypothetical protein
MGGRTDGKEFGQAFNDPQQQGKKIVIQFGSDSPIAGPRCCFLSCKLAGKLGKQHNSRERGPEAGRAEIGLLPRPGKQLLKSRVLLPREV